MALYANKQHILYSQSVSSSKAWLCLWTTYNYILKKSQHLFVYVTFVLMLWIVYA